MKQCDVVIIGGGIAGLTVAKYLAEEGVDFVLFEEHNDWFQKACGEGIIAEIAGYNFFDIYESKRGVEREVKETVVHSRYGDVLLCLPYFIVDKKRVEEELARQVIKKGGRIIMNEKVTEIQGLKPLVLPQNVEAEIVVGADGANSLVRRWLGVSDPYMGFAVETKAKLEIPMDKSHVELKGETVPYGYSWFFPKKNSWNIGVGAFHIKYFKDSFKRFRSRFKNVKGWRGAFLPLSRPTRTYGRRGILVGDSASQVISSVGAGNTTAAICGKLAAECITRFSRSGYRNMDLSLYEKIWRKSLLKLFSVSYFSSRLFFTLFRINEYLADVLLRKMVESVSKLYRR